jgi:hypothetical protein
LIGWGIIALISGPGTDWVGLASFPAAVVLVVLYRRFVQRRPAWGPEASRFPERGVGVARIRRRLVRAGIDPDRIGTHRLAARLQPRPAQPAAPLRETAGDPTESPAHYLGLLEELHDAGVLDDDEFRASRTRLLDRLRG